MTLYDVLIIIQYVSIVLLIIEIIYVFAHWTNQIHSYLLLSCIATLVNNVGYLMVMTSESEGASLAGVKMSYLGRTWVPFSLFMFVMTACKVKVPNLLKYILVGIHLTTLTMVFATGHAPLYYSSVTYVTTGMFPHLEMGHGLWYKGYSLLLVVYIIFGLYKLIRVTVSEQNKVTRKRLILVCFAIATNSLFFGIQMSGVTPTYDDTVMGYSISAIIMFIAIFKYSLFDTFQVVKDYVIDEVSEGIIVVDKEDNIEYYNKPAKEIYPVLEARGPMILESIKISIEKKEPLLVDGKIYTPESRPLINDGEVKGTIYVLVDDTEHYQYMEQLKEQKEIAEAANQSKSAFLSVVSHEIRTPMNAVVGMTDLLLREKEALTTKQEKYLRNIKNSGAALVMIVNDILDQSKIEAGKMEIVEDAYELRPMIDDVKMIIENRIGSKPIHLICDIEEDVPEYLIGDSLRIRQILINLMNNAVKFTEEGFIRLCIEVKDSRDDKKYLRFSIKDSGQGIREEDLKKLGEAFTQVDVKKNHSKEGTGLGLSISRDFISMMGGRLEVSSEYGSGTEFYFTIWQGVADKISTGVTKQAWQEEDEFIAPSANILIVDDTEVNLMIAAELLSVLQMNIDTAESGEKAIELAASKRYDAIFMDYMMPYMDGVETTKKIRELAVAAADEGDHEASEHYRNVPIIVLSGDTSDETKEKFMHAGIDDFTEKPVVLKRLKRLLIKWLPEEMIEGVE